MRLPLPLLGAGVVLLLGACTQASATGPTIVQPVGVPEVVAPPAAAAGGACQLLNYDVLAEALETRFDVAAATNQGKTYTCVVRSSEVSLPDLVLTVSPTTADEAVFRSELEPDGAQSVKSLGKAAYRATAKAAKGRGPTAEVCWLSADKRMLSLRLTLPVGTPKSAATPLATGLVAVAKQIDAVRS